MTQSAKKDVLVEAWGPAYENSKHYWTVFPLDFVELLSPSLDFGLGTKAILLLLVLRCFAAKKDSAYPSLETLAGLLGTSKSRVSELLDLLQSEGFIRIVLPEKKGRGQKTTYDLTPMYAKLAELRKRQETKATEEPAESALTKPAQVTNPLAVSPEDEAELDRAIALMKQKVAEAERAAEAADRAEEGA
jgi:DNA-binding MarR family transcriptional regulator